MRVLTLVLSFVFLWLSGCNSSSGRRTAPPPPVTQPPPTHLPPNPQPSISCEYHYQSQMVYGPSCTKKYCYTWGWCQGFGTRFLFCGAIKNEYGNWKCPDASACVMAPNPGFHPLQFRRACSSGIVFDDEGSDDETDKEDEEDKSSKPRAFMGDEDRP